MEDIKEGFSGCSAAAAPPAFRRRHTDRTPELPLQTSFFLEVLSDDKSHHLLNSCFLCNKSLGNNADIFMYRGNIPFCSNDCREEQIDMDEDEEKEKNWKFAVKKEQQQKKKSSTSPQSGTIHVRAGIDVAG